MRRSSLVELTGHDNSAADIMVHICTGAFMVHILYRYYCIQNKHKYVQVLIRGCSCRFWENFYRILNVISPGGFSNV